MKRLLLILGIILLLTLSAWGDDIRKSGMNLGMSPSPSGGGVSYRLNDSFSTDVAAGSVDGTLAVPGPGTRTVADSHSPPYLSISGGYLVFGGRVNDGDPRVSYTITDEVGRIVLSKVYQSSTDYIFPIFNRTSSWSGTALVAGCVYSYSTGMDKNIQTSTYTGTGNKILGNIRGANKYYSFLGNYLYYICSETSSWGTAFNFLASNSTYPMNVDFIRIPYLLWTPKPISADSFGGTWPTTDGGGLTGLEAGGSGLTWGGFLSGTGTTGAGVTWDHEWNFSNSLNDNPGNGYSAVNLTMNSGSPTYAADWSGIATESLKRVGTTYAKNDSPPTEISTLGSIFTIKIAFYIPPTTATDSLYFYTGNPDGVQFYCNNKKPVIYASSYIYDNNYLLSSGWHQGIATLSGGVCKLYIDGNFIASGACSPPGVGSTIHINDSPADTCVAQVATLKGTAITAAQVKAEYEKWVATSDANVYARLYGGPDPGANGLTNQSGAVTEGTWGSENAGEFSYQAYALRYSTTAGNPGSFDNTTNLLRRTGTWSIAGGKAVNAPVGGANVITNGDFAAWPGVGDPNNTPTGWTVAGGVTATKYIHNATNQAEFKSGVGEYLELYQSIDTVGAWHRYSFDLNTIVSGLISADTSGAAVLYYNSTGTKAGTFRAAGAGTGFIVPPSTDITVDNLSITALPLNQLITAINHTGTPDVYASVSPTIATGFQAGLALNIDDPNNPTNFNLIYYNQNDAKVYAERCVNGTYANIFASSSQTYSDGKPLVARRIGEGSNNLYVWYNNVYVGVGTASPNSTWHGMFQTGASSAETNMDDWFCYGSGTNGEYNILNAFTN